MFPNRADILVSLANKTFFEAINEQSIRTDLFRPVDIDPILSHLRALGSNDSLSVNDFTTKLCWFLGVCSFLAHLDIEHIDFNSFEWTFNADELVLQVVVAPKEKGLGQRIHRTTYVHKHLDSLPCRVAAIKSYYTCIAHRPCIFPYPVLPHLSIEYLIRDVRDPFKPAHAQRIGNNVNRIMILLPLPPGQRPFKARALGSTRALLHTVSLSTMSNTMAAGRLEERKIVSHCLC
jgi:hypothetical protein